MKSARVIFAGTPAFARASLEALCRAGIAPVAVLTQPDRPAGRGKKLKQSPVKRFAQQQGLDVLQPATLRDADIVAELDALDADIMIVAAYGLLLPQQVLDSPRRGCVNVHASLLPRWRGAAPIQAAILHGDASSGACLMQMTAGLDCGPVYACESIDIAAAESAGQLHDRLAELGASLLLRHLDDILAGRLMADAQDEALVTYAPKIKTADAELDFERTAEALVRHVRAYNPLPGAWFMLGDERIKCWAAESLPDVTAEPGSILASGADGIQVATTDGVLNMTGLQRPGKRPVDAATFSAQLELDGLTL